MKKQIFFTIGLLIFVLISCQKESQFDNQEYQTRSSNSKSTYKENNSGHIKIAVLSDIHYMDPSLLQNNGANGTAFKTMLLGEPYKVLLEYSPAIFDKVISELQFEKPDIVLIAGDMAKDGERICHEKVAGIFNQLQQSGMKVIVVPGNNDINNSAAVAYNGNTSSPVPNISPAEFISLYGNFGYNTAIAKDPNSLSYVAEPYPGLRILAIDAERYSPIYHRSGRIKSGTMQWIKQQMAKAKENNVTVLGLMHHSIIEHFSGQTTLFAYTVVEDTTSSIADNDNWKARADSLIAWGLKVMLTGHNHATDISERTTNGNTLYDIATGSLVTPPSPYRILVLKNKELEISTNYIKSINMSFTDNQSFAEYSNHALSSNFDSFFHKAFPLKPFYLDTSLVDYATPLGRNAYMAFIAGDENISPLEQAKIDSLQAKIDSLNNINPVPGIPGVTTWAISTLWTDLGIKDNKWHIKLTNQ